MSKENNYLTITDTKLTSTSQKESNGWLKLNKQIKHAIQFINKKFRF